MKLTNTNLLRIGKREIKLSNLDKVLYPETGFTKGDVIDYYLNIAPVVLPYLKGRPLTLKRYPNGVDAEFFYEKRCPKFRPDWLKTAHVIGGTVGPIDFCQVDDAASLAWIANLASIELHPLLCKSPHFDRPTMMVFDFDPGPPAGVIDAARIALRTHDLLEQVGLQCWPKTSGGKGIHLAVPLNTPVKFEDTKHFARAIAEALEASYPNEVLSNMSKALRKNKVFVDWSQNDQHKTTACVYSLRARSRPTVSTPITWKELESAVKKHDAEAITFEADDVIKRVKAKGDLFEPVLKTKQRLPKSL